MCATVSNELEEEGREERVRERIERIEEGRTDGWNLSESNNERALVVT